MTNPSNLSHYREDPVETFETDLEDRNGRRGEERKIDFENSRSKVSLLI